MSTSLKVINRTIKFLNNFVVEATYQKRLIVLRTNTNYFSCRVKNCVFVSIYVL